MMTVPSEPEAAADALIAAFAEHSARNKFMIPERTLEELSEDELSAQPCTYLRGGASTYANLQIADAPQRLIEIFASAEVSNRFANLDAFDVTKLRTADVPCLGGRLAFLPHRAGKIEVPFFVGERNIVLAGRTNEWIYETMSSRPPPQLDGDLLGYVRFFFSTVVGQIGAFRLAESAQDAVWLPNASEECRREFTEKLSPPRILGTDEDGRQELRGTVVFKNALFITSVKVSANWNLELANEDLLMEDLPIAFGQRVDLLVWR